MSDKLFSYENELAVLSTVIKNPDFYFGCGVRFFMFSSSANQVIFQELESLNERQLIADAHLLISSLEGSGLLAKVGGREYIEQILAMSFPPENFKEYCNLLVLSYKARMFVSAASKVKAGELTADNVESSIRDFKTTMESLTELSGSSGAYHIADNIRSAFEEIIARTKNPGVRGHSWGISDIDVSTGGKSPGDWLILGGRPSQGKTGLICNSILTDGKNGVPVLFFEKEMNYNSLVERLVAIDSGVELQKIRLGLLTKDEVGLIGESITKIRKFPIYIDTSFTSDIHYVDSTVQKFRANHGVEVVYLDYLQLMAERGDNQTQELGRISRMCKLIANDQSVCMVGVSQLNRSVEARENKRPIMSDLRQSGNLEEDADFVVGLYRDDYYNKESKYKNLMEFIILKARNGPIGTITLKFEPETNRIIGK
jgi:replicative DNA helicase